MSRSTRTARAASNGSAAPTLDPKLADALRAAEPIGSEIIDQILEATGQPVDPAFRAKLAEIWSESFGAALAQEMLGHATPEPEPAPVVEAPKPTSYAEYLLVDLRKQLAKMDARHEENRAGLVARIEAQELKIARKAAAKAAAQADDALFLAAYREAYAAMYEARTGRTAGL